MISKPEELDLTLEDHDKALHEISFLLHNMTGTVSELVGRATRTVALSAGREAAHKMTAFGETTEPHEVIKAVIQKLSGGFHLEARWEGEDLILTFQHCIIRELSRKAELDLGGPLCTMFHGYVNGIIAELTKKGVRFKIESVGKEQCVINHLF